MACRTTQVRFPEKTLNKPNVPQTEELQQPPSKPVFQLLQSKASERWMSGLSRTPGKRVWVNSPPRVRIPPAPPEYQ